MSSLSKGEVRDGSLRETVATGLAAQCSTARSGVVPESSEPSG